VKLCSLAEGVNILEETDAPIFRMEERKCKTSGSEGCRYMKKCKGNMSFGDADDTDFHCNCKFFSLRCLLDALNIQTAGASEKIVPFNQTTCYHTGVFVTFSQFCRPSIPILPTK
jgi:hypothetical protein